MPGLALDLFAWLEGRERERVFLEMAAEDGGGSLVLLRGRAWISLAVPFPPGVFARSVVAVGLRRKQPLSSHSEAEEETGAAAADLP